MLKPLLQDDEFLADVAAAKAELGHVHLWWLGQSGFLLQHDQRHLLIDPYLSDALTHKYAESPKPHVRMTERIVAPERLDFIDVVTSSHCHTDHLDADTLVPIMRANPRLELVIAEANREVVVDRLKAMAEWPRGLDAGKSLRLAGFTIHGVPAAHNELTKDQWGRYTHLGYVIEAGAFVFYHSGDTLRFEGMETWLQRWPIDVALLPINGNLASRGVAGNLSGAEAARLAKDANARSVIPCHYEMFEFNTVTTLEFEAEARRLGQPFRTLRCGERWSTAELGAR